MGQAHSEAQKEVGMMTDPPAPYVKALLVVEKVWALDSLAFLEE